MKPERYKSIRAKNYCTRCWRQSEVCNMYLNLDYKLICEACYQEEVKYIQTKLSGRYLGKKLDKINKDFKEFKNDL